MEKSRVVTYPFIIIAREAPYQSPIVQCMICGHYDADTVFHPLTLRVTNTIRIGNVRIPVPGTRHQNIICCPRCLALEERSLGSMIHNFMAGEAIDAEED